MADFPENKQSEEKPILGTGEGEVPLVKPSPDVQVRTMASDINSLKETGGQNVKPYTPPPDSLAKDQQTVEPPPVKQTPKTQSVPPMSGGSPPSPPSTNLETKSPMKDKKSSKGLAIGIIVFLIIVGLAAIGYFFVLPLISSPDIDTPIDIEEAAPPVDEPPLIPSAEEEAPPVEEEEPLAEEEPPLTPTHSSLLQTSADVISEVTLSEINLAAIKEGFDLTTSSEPTFKELIFKDSDDQVLNFAQIMQNILPTLFTEELSAIFEENNFTIFSYSDDQNVWAGYIGKLKADSVIADAQSNISQLEQSTELNNLFLTAPGESQEWKDGQVEGVASRYLIFENGAALNYAWLNDVFIIGTSYPSFKEAIKKLQ